jgi:hypothetical protein
VAGRHYQLALNNGTAVGASILLYLIDEHGGLIPFEATTGEASTGETVQWLWLQNETEITPAPSVYPVAARQFVAPPGVVDVAVQIQGEWTAGTGAFVIPSLQLVEAIP